MLWVCEHQLFLACICTPKTMVCLDACIASSLCIAQFVAKGKNMSRVFFELLQSIFEESGITTTFPYSSPSGIFTAYAIDFILREDFLQAKSANGYVQNFTVVARHDGCLDVVCFDVFEDLVPTIVQRTLLSSALP